MGKDKFGLKDIYIYSIKKVSSKDPVLNDPVLKVIPRPVFQDGF